MGKIYTRDGRYGIDYIDGHGRRVRRVVASDKSVAQKLLGDAVKASERVRAGVLLADPREAKKPFQQHVDSYIAELKRRGRDQMYRYIVKLHLENAAEVQGWDCLAACTAKSISEYLRKVADQGLSAKTVNAHRADLAAFCGWAVRTGLLEANPCDHVQKSAVKADKKRRALSVAECRALLAAAPEPRRTVYLFLIFTGLRRSEAGAIKWAHLHLDVANPYVELPPSITKSGKAESVPLVPEVVGALNASRRGVQPSKAVFDEIPSMEEFRTDLAAAKIEEADARGRKVVLHSLRHSLATMLAVSGVAVAIAQRIMRHRDVRLTMEAYCDEGLLPLASAMNSLPSMTGASSGEPTTSRASSPILVGSAYS
jgi:integrase